MPVDGRFAAVEETLTIVPAPALAHPGQGRSRRADGAEQVELERGLPDLVGHVLELANLAVADVVDEDVEPSVAFDRLLHDALRLARLREVGPQLAAAASGRHDGRSLGAQQLRGLEADAAGGAGDEADAVGETEVHGWLA